MANRLVDIALGAGLVVLVFFVAVSLLIAYLQRIHWLDEDEKE